MDNNNEFNSSSKIYSDVEALKKRLQYLESENAILKTDSEKLRVITEEANIAYAIHKIILDENDNPIDFEWLEANDKYLNVTQLSRNDIIGKRGRTVIPNLEKKWIDIYGKVALTLQSVSMFDHSEYLDKYWRVKAFSHEKLYFTVILEDITETKKAELKFLGSEIRSQNIIQSSPMGMLFYKLDENESLIFQGANFAADKILGIDTGILIGKTIEEAFPPLEKTDIPRKYRNAAKLGESWYTEQVEYCDNDISGAYEVHAFQTEPNNMAVMFNEITKRKIIEENLKASEKKLNTLFQAMTEVVVLHKLIFDDEGNPSDYILIDCNKEFEKLTNKKREEILGQKASEFYGIKKAPFLKEYSKVATTLEPIEFSTYYPPLDKHFLISVVAPQENQFATISTDVTAIKEIEEMLRAKNDELEGYLYVASHDLRSPLVNIQGFSQRMQLFIEDLQGIINSNNLDASRDEITNIFDVEVPKTFKYIFLAVEKMDKLIRGLLQISRTGRMQMNIDKIYVTPLIKKIIDTMNYQLSETGGRIIIDDLSDCYGDQDQLNQLFSNIISNAIKYRDSSRDLVIRISSAELYNNVVYKISDNGIGIDEKHMKRIWDVFYQVNPAKNSNSEGIGLSIVKRISDKHKGKVWAESSVNKGTTFFVKLKNKPFTV